MDELPVEERPIRQPCFTWRGRESGTTRKFEGTVEPFADVEEEVVWAEKLVGPNNSLTAVNDGDGNYN